MKISEILNPDKQKALKGSEEKKKESKNSLTEIAKTLHKTLPELHKELQMMEELRGMTIEQMEETLRRKAERRGKTIAQIVAKWRHNRNNKRNRALRNEKELQGDFSRS